jgi:phage I-like protein
MKKNLVIGLCLSLWACGTAEQKKAGVSEEAAKDVEAILAKSGGEGCFIPYQAKVCELMDKAAVAQILGVDAAKMEAEDAMKMLHEMGNKKDQPYQGSEHTFCEYKWKDEDRKIKEYVEQLGRELEVAMYAYVQIGNFAPRKDVAAFKQYYRNVSEEEMSQALDKAGEQMQKDGKYTNEQVGTAKGLGGGLVKGRTVTYLDNLGEAAASIRTKAYGEQTELVVYYKGNEFQVEVKMAGKTHAENLEYSKKIALEVLKKCN